MYMYICMHIDTYIYIHVYIYISCDTMGCNGDVIGSTICIYVYSCIYIYTYNANNMRGICPKMDKTQKKNANNVF